MFFLWGIAATFRSGAKKAWVVDNLEKAKRKDLIQPYLTKSRMIFAGGFVISGLILAGIIFLFSADMEFTLFNIFAPL